MKGLVIVESIRKANTIGQILGPSWKVTPCLGHIRDMERKAGPGEGFGIDPVDCTISYVVIKPEVVDRLLDEAKSHETIYLATDPDTEGEAIAWHLGEIFAGKRICRIRFNEITAAAVQRALDIPQRIDMAMVHSYEGRRALDRLIGYRLAEKFSYSQGDEPRRHPGRLQLAALSLMVQHQNQVRSGHAVEHYYVDATCKTNTNTIGGSGQIVARWQFQDFCRDSSTVQWFDRSTAQTVCHAQNFVVDSVQERSVVEPPPPPFVTSTLLQVAWDRLGFPPEDTMQAAQCLFDQGAITFHRTSSPILSSAACSAIEGCLVLNAISPRRDVELNTSADLSGGHEAIRPTDIEVLQVASDDQQQALYQLIRDRTLASRMADCRYLLTTFVLRATDVVLEGKPLFFTATYSEMRAVGWRRVPSEVDRTGQAGPQSHLSDKPALSAGMQLTGTSQILAQDVQPPPFSHASLIESLVGAGIGRPASFGNIASKLLRLGYISMSEGCLVPRSGGKSIIEHLEQSRSCVVDLQYCRDVELQLDQIAQLDGQSFPAYQSLVRATNRRLDEDFRRMAPAPGKPFHAHHCCGEPMLVSRSSKHSYVFSCARYPSCRNTVLPTGSEMAAIHLAKKARGPRAIGALLPLPKTRDLF